MKRYRKSTLMIFNIPSIPESPSLPVREAFLFHFNCHVGIHVIHFAFREALFTIFCSCCNSMEKKSDKCFYLFLDPTCWRWCVSLLNQMQEFSSWLMKNWHKQRRKECFSNPVSVVFCSLYPSSLLPKSSGFLD
jgi:hypothetical protein